MKMERTLASRLKQVITIQHQVKQSDEAGGFIRQWHDLIELFAEIQPLGDYRASQGVRFDLGQLMTYGFYKMTIRYNSKITTKMRVSYDSKIFTIKRVINDQDCQKETVLIVEEGAMI